MNFIRFGGLSPVKQEQYTTGEDKTFHNPPCKHGLYAFPFPYIEKFLLSSTDFPGHISNKTQWLKDENNNKIKFDDFFDITKEYNTKLDRFPVNTKYIKLLKKLNIPLSNIRSIYDEEKETHYITVLNKPKIFEYDGEIWHHLGEYLKPNQILSSSGSWTLSDMDNYKIALQTDIHDTKKDMIKLCKISNIDINNYFDKDPYKTMYNKDHLEVFIEHL